MYKITYEKAKEELMALLTKNEPLTKIEKTTTNADSWPKTQWNISEFEIYHAAAMDILFSFYEKREMKKYMIFFNRIREYGLTTII